MAVSVEDKRIGVVSEQLNLIGIVGLDPGEHNVINNALGNHFNAFGHLHSPKGKSKWCGPLLWRTDDDRWTPGYRVQQLGVLQTPRSTVGGTPKVPL